MATLAFIQSYRTCHIVTHPPDTDCAGALEYGQGARAPEYGQDARAPLGSFNPAYL